MYDIDGIYRYITFKLKNMLGWLNTEKSRI